MGNHIPQESNAIIVYAVLILDDHEIVFANEKVYQLIGITSNDRLGESFDDFLKFVHSTDISRLTSAFHSVLSGESEFEELSINLRNIDNKFVAVNVLINKVLFNQKSAIQLILVNTPPPKQDAFMQELINALAQATNTRQAMEIVLVSLRDVIEYDRAGLFLLDEDQEVFQVGEESSGNLFNRSIKAAPIVLEFERTKTPIIVPDIKEDPRFENWPDMGPLRGWIGAPLFSDDEMIGFISLGSLIPNAYHNQDAETLLAFTNRVAEVLVQTYWREQNLKKSEELEIISNITFALGKAETQEAPFEAIMGLLSGFFRAPRFILFLPESTNDKLAVRYSLEEKYNKLSYSVSDDILWQVFKSGKSYLLNDFHQSSTAINDDLLGELSEGLSSAAYLPLKVKETSIGVLFIGYENRGGLNKRSLRQFETIAGIAGIFLQRAVVLEGLEKQVKIRTRHLSTLYEINSVASGLGNLYDVLDQILEITLLAIGCRSGSIHLLDEELKELDLVTYAGALEKLAPVMETIPTNNAFWQAMEHSSNPLILPDLLEEPSIPDAIRANCGVFNRAYIGIPVRSKGKPLGLLSLFGASIMEYTIDDVTLFMTIADQIGERVERSRLMEQAEKAAVIEERQRLARELHDSITQLLYSQVLFSGAGLRELRQGKYDVAEQHFSRIDEAAHQALKEMRLLVYELRDTDYMNEGLVRVLQHRLDAVEKRSAIQVELIVDDEIELGEEIQRDLYYIATEALNNTLKHASASHVVVRISSLDNGIQLEVIDDGKGFDVEKMMKSGGMGLTSMEARADKIGGTLEITSNPGEGTCVLVKIKERI